MYYVYILQSRSTGRYYVGYSADINARLAQHNSQSNPNRSTRNRGPWQVIYTEKLPDKATAYARERQIKSYKGGNGFKKLLGLL